MQYQLILDFFKLENVGMILVKGVKDKGDIKGNVALEEAYALGSSIISGQENEYDEQMKAKRNAEYLDMIDKSMAEAEAGGFIIKTIGELEEEK